MKKLLMSEENINDAVLSFLISISIINENDSVEIKLPLKTTKDGLVTVKVTKKEVR